MTNRKTGNQKRKYSFNRYEDIDKCIWKVFDNFGHDEKIENLVYWTRKLKKERAAFRKKAVKYDELQSILEEYNVTPEILREVLLTGQMFRNQPTLEECIKEWEARGYELKIDKENKNLIILWNIQKLALFEIDLKYKRIKCKYQIPSRISYEIDKSFAYVDFEELYLLPKTLKALEEMKYD